MDNDATVLTEAFFNRVHKLAHRFEDVNPAAVPGKNVASPLPFVSAEIKNNGVLVEFVVESKRSITLVLKPRAFGFRERRAE